MNVTRQVLAVLVFGAVATSAAHARHHARHHHQPAGQVPINRTGNNAAASATNGNASAHGSDGGRQEPAPNGVDGATHKGVRAIPTDLGQRGAAPHPNAAPTGANVNAGGHAGAQAQHGAGANAVDLIFVRPPGRNAKHPNRLGTPGKATAAGPTKMTGHQPHRRDPGVAAAAKNAIGASVQPNVVVTTTGTGHASPGPNAAAAATKANAIGAEVGRQAPGSPAKTGMAAPASAGHPAAAPAAMAALSTHGGGISGTGIGRLGSALGTIGGPARVVVGVSGTGMRPKR